MNNSTLRKVIAVIALAILLGVILAKIRRERTPAHPERFLESTVPID